MLVYGNWKLHHSKADAERNLRDLKEASWPKEHMRLGVAPVAPFLSFAADILKGSDIELGAQNVFYEEKGAFTGEWSASQLKDVGCDFAIVGHSERRSIFGESSESVAKKVVACLQQELMPICCIGETLAERSKDLFEQVIESQLLPVIQLLKKSGLAGRLVFAYEPVWAIGTGKVASSKEIDLAHHFIKSFLKTHGISQMCPNFQVIYGGSVTPENVLGIVLAPDVDGVLVGGASLQASSFLSIVSTVAKALKEKENPSLQA